MAMAGRRKTRLGVVVSSKMDKTVVVAVETRKFHRLYKKARRLTKRYKAHDERNAGRVGDKVIIEETRPLSKEKRWRLVEVLVRGAGVELAVEAEELPEAAPTAATAAAVAEAAPAEASTVAVEEELTEAVAEEAPTPAEAAAEEEAPPAEAVAEEAPTPTGDAEEEVEET